MNVDYFVNDGNIYATKGDGLNGYPCIVSHTDTVHEICTGKVEVIEVKGNLVAFNADNLEQIGTGGDDKNGIYVCLEILANCDNVKAVFFRDEETGCNGSYNALTTFFEDCNFILQCDRKGNSDFVTNAASTELSSKEFQQTIKPIVNKFGYSFYKHGGLTDVVALKEIGVNLCMANISCGYYNPHSPSEYINLRDLHNTYKLVHAIVVKHGKTYFKHRAKVKRYKSYNSGYNSLNWEYPAATASPKYNPNECEACGGNSNKVSYLKEWNMFVCNSCKDTYL